MRAATSCRTCGTEALENAGFCHRCGSPVAEPALHAEYKQVTVLFADVVHSMDIATAVGEQVGMAQRMESVAPPGGVMLSASTARLVESSAALGAAELVQIKGAH